MTNREFYKEQILDIACQGGTFGVNKSDNTVHACCDMDCNDCLFHHKCTDEAIKEWADAEYVKPKTENEKFCETLNVGEVIAVGVVKDGIIDFPTYERFLRYDEAKDLIVTRNGCLNEVSWEHGRKLSSIERGNNDNR